jgi:LPXTG-motif cell wall-anchored protein
MQLSPRERADFDEIVAQLRLEDADLDAEAPRRHSMTLLLCVVVALLGFGIGMALFVHRPEIFLPLIGVAAVLGGVLLYRRKRKSRPAAD